MTLAGVVGDVEFHAGLLGSHEIAGVIDFASVQPYKVKCQVGR
jgi:hypothetical protein